MSEPLDYPAWVSQLLRGLGYGAVADKLSTLIADLERERNDWRARSIACGEEMQRLAQLLATLGMEQTP